MSTVPEIIEREMKLKALEEYSKEQALNSWIYRQLIKEYSEDCDE